MLKMLMPAVKKILAKHKWSIDNQYVYLLIAKWPGEKTVCCRLLDGLVICTLKVPLMEPVAGWVSTLRLLAPRKSLFMGKSTPNYIWLAFATRNVPADNSTPSRRCLVNHDATKPQVSVPVNLLLEVGPVL